MTDRKKDGRGAGTAPYAPRAPLGGASTTGPLAGAMILSEDLEADPTRPVREAVDLLAKTKNSFKSKQVGDAREILERWLEAVLPDLPDPVLPDNPISIRVDEELGRELASRGDISGAAAKRDLMRYYALLREEVQRFWFSVHELLTIVSVIAMGGPSLQPSLLWAAVEAYLRRDRQREGGPDATLTDVDEAFVAALKDLSPSAIAALYDALERFRRIHPSRERDPAHALRQVGLLGQPRFGYGGPATTAAKKRT